MQTFFGLLWLVITIVAPAVAQDRMPAIPADKMTDAQKKAVAEFSASRGTVVVGPFVPMLRSPEVMVRAASVGEYLRFKSPVPQKLKEFAILITARQWTQQFEWYSHVSLAVKAGLSPEIVKTLAEGARPAGMSDDEQLVYELCMEVQHNRSISDVTYANAVAKFGEQGVIDLVSINGYYTFLSMVMNAARTPVPPGTEPPLKTFPR